MTNHFHYNSLSINWASIINESIESKSTHKIECIIQSHPDIDLNEPLSIALNLQQPNIVNILIASGAKIVKKHKDIKTKKAIIVIMGPDSTGAVKQYAKLYDELLLQRKVDLLVINFNEVELPLDEVQKQISSFISYKKNITIILNMHGYVNHSSHFVVYNPKKGIYLKTADFVGAIMESIKQKLGYEQPVDFLLRSCFGAHATKDVIKILPLGSSFIGMGAGLIYSTPNSVEAYYSAIMHYDDHNFSPHRLFFIDSLNPFSYKMSNNTCTTVLSKRGEFYSLEKMSQHTLETQRDKLSDYKIRAEIIERVKDVVKDGIGFPKCVFGEGMRSYERVEYMVNSTMDVLVNRNFSLFDALKNNKGFFMRANDICHEAGISKRYKENFKEDFLSDIQDIYSPSYGNLMLLVLSELHDISGDIYNDSGNYSTIICSPI